MAPWEEEELLLRRESSRSQLSSGSPGLWVHLYLAPSVQGESAIRFTSGAFSAEDICVAAAKECGILPVYHSLFSLASDDLSYWFPPNHIFIVGESTSITLLYRVRFFFPNWFGQGSRKSYRYGLTKSRISSVLDYCVIDFLFAQSRSDFVLGQAGVRPNLKMQEECLGMAMLDLLRISKERNQSLRDICKKVSYKSCLPPEHKEAIQRLDRLTRYRIRKLLKQVLCRLSHCQADGHSLKLKYLLDLAAVEPSFGTELFRVRDPAWSQQGEDSAFRFIRVSGESGIQWSTGDGQDWQTFCDFPEIIDISIKQTSRDKVPLGSRVVTVSRQDSRLLEAEFHTLREALSFVSLIDGYFRLTTDSAHYFCEEVAPPSLLQDMESCCHGPITSEFAAHKLKRAGACSGMYLLRHSPKDFDKYFITICVETPLGMDYKDCLVLKGTDFCLSGLQRHFCSLRELLGYYQHSGLLLAGFPTKLGPCCPPRPKELTNLVIVRSNCSAETLASPLVEHPHASHVQFHMIKHEDLQWGDSLGQGSFTKIFKGSMTDSVEGESHVTEVLLKVLESTHKNCWESFFEAASVMSQVSHKHLLLVYGISIHGSKNIMVQEFVKHGALDLFLKKRRGSISVSWKLDVAKQLACALNFLEDKNIIHGNICAKNLLLAREGDTATGSPPFIKLSDPGISTAILDREVVLDRIPWVAPELVLVDSDRLALESDKWSFGTTLWEIFNGGEVPLLGREPQQKLQFYNNQRQLPALKWTELADLISQCMDYQPGLRPSFRGIIRQLNSLITSDYELLCDLRPSAAPEKDTFWRCLNVTDRQEPMLYEDRHLRYIYRLGKGNFGSVELCRYDPLADNTGELVAVKKLQHSKREHQADFEKEIGIMKSLHNDYIVKYKGICYSMGRQNVRLVMEYLPNGNLPGYLEKNRERVDSKRLLLYASQISKGMEYLQMMRHVHRDLAARNILVASDTLVKISDFGLTKILQVDKEYYRVKEPGESPIFWYAPESLQECKFSPKSDVWSFGVVLHELFSYCERVWSPTQLCLQQIGRDKQGPTILLHLFHLLKSEWRLPAPADCPPKVLCVMRRCWSYNADERPSFTQLDAQIEALREERGDSQE
ncbi:tyrosine-protein kinase JAK2-like [Acipenser ruthenus]|uniref:tyrosine-protein kinase JAK2-like n=1 Tax=Acipenser ruthenus TaxID=7906 RepID=UPI002741D57B|nr:tyrosine-protein kinase JAK2-like [Acipenser ruthenus]XP_034767780.2 tyrosine-protein kinase JAK2-like [Acipenser ruthenus]XP_058869844.1 tyrosine-protein kinase JAK2-like [Acipenser ruthenus]